MFKRRLIVRRILLSTREAKLLQLLYIEIK